MHLKPRKLVSITIKGKKTALRPHHTVVLADSAAKKLLSQHPHLFKRVKG